jgi:subtilisin
VRSQGGWRPGRVAAWLGLCAALLLCALSGATASGFDRVLIGFRGRPDAAAVSRLGARIQYVYDLVPAVAAEVPSNRVEAVKRLPGVLYVEPDYPVYATGGAAISPLTSVWSQFDPLTEVLPWGIARIHAPEVWLGAPPNMGAGVSVGIIDTGIDYTHPDLAANYVLGYDFVNRDWDPLDDNGHGTHVAGIIAAIDDGPNVLYGGSMVSVVGAAPQVSLYIAKALDSNGVGSTSNIVAALNQAAKHGVDVVNMSIGSPFSSRTFQAACDNAYAAGVLLVAAAGNEALPWLDVPARYGSVLSVAAINEANQRASFSNYNNNLELCAPGVDVLSTMPGYPVTLTQAPYYYQMDYDALSGTSMACPHVTAAAALVMAAHPDWTNVQVRQRLDATAADLGAPGRDRYYGFGLVDAAAAD